MNPESVVQDLELRGVRLEARDDLLHLDAPKGAVSAELRSYLLEHKSEVLEILVGRERERTERSELLIWATEFGNLDLELEEPVNFNETNLRNVTTKKVSEHARRHLRTIAMAEMARRGFTWGSWTVEWHEEMEQEALGSLRAIREALRGQERSQ